MGTLHFKDRQRATRVTAVGQNFSKHNAVRGSRAKKKKKET